MGDHVSSDSSDAATVEQALADPGCLGRPGRISDRSLFLRKFLSKGRVISAAMPSSRALASGVLRQVDFSRPATIVELGAGTGPVTERIIDQLRPFHRFVAVENDPDFCRVLRRRFPETSLLQADASRIAQPLASMGIQGVDYVVSGLPMPSMPPRAAVRLWQWLRYALAPGGLFMQITIAPWVYHRFYSRLFESVDYRMVWWNVPPGGVYCCAKPRGHLVRRSRSSF